MNIRPLTPALKERAETEFNETPKLLEESLDILKIWLSKQQHLKYRNDDQFLVSFLRCCKYNLQRTKDKLDGYYTFRTVAPEIAANWDPLLPDNQAVLKLGIVCPLPIPSNDPGSPHILMVRYGNYDPEIVTATALIKDHALNIDVLFNESDNAVVSGIKFIWDLNGLQLKTALQSSLTLIRKVIFGWEKGYPPRYKGVYFINVPTYFEPIINIGKRIISKKLTSRLHFYATGNLEELYKEIPKEILPTEYGGYAGPYYNLAAKWKKVVESHRQRLIEEKNYYTDESKRDGQPNTIESLFGVEGTFRKLEID